MGYYQWATTPKREVCFNPSPKIEESQKPQGNRRSSSSFRNFRKILWNELASRTSSYQLCTEELNALWRDRSDDEKIIYESDPAEVCNRCKVVNSSSVDWFACDICNDW